MPDDKNVFALFYGPTMLAFLTGDELALKGDHDTILRGLSKHPASNTFQLINQGKTYTLIPLYEVNKQSYGVYATLRNH